MLLSLVPTYWNPQFKSISHCTGLQRSGKSCRLRWVNHLRPDLKRSNITSEEERLIFDLHARWGTRWSQIAERIPGRTDNEIKNYCRTHLKKKLQNSAHYNCSPQGKQVVLPRQSLEVSTGDAVKTPLLYEINYNHTMFNTETPMDKFTIEEVIRDIEKVQVQVDGSSEGVGSIQNDMGTTGHDAVELSKMAYTFVWEIPLESHATQVYEASCSANPELMCPTFNYESDSESDVLLWNI
ncbi:hypothetical protein SUGI_0299300 [Cryptomeria japonica]|nr:hypothetical protein SUGI_0299300 [Cryptomeria japonica]